MAAGVRPEINWHAHFQEIAMRCHIFLSLLLALIIVGCESQNRPPLAPANENPQDAGGPKVFTGTLQSGVVGIGGEHTGWIIASDGGAGGMEVDISKVREDARANDGKRVTITGKLMNKTYTERGKVQVLVADSIKPAEKAGANQAAGKAVG